jgi:hypothetical protein
MRRRLVDTRSGARPEIGGVDVKIYVCVYRNLKPSTEDLASVRARSENYPELAEYLRAYEQNESWLDWGDDPSFHSASASGGPVTWGVCRPNVREWISIGDAVAFICARQEPAGWRYYYVGCGTVAERIEANQRFERFPKYFNVLAAPASAGELSNVEVIGYHEDWRRRAKSPYVVFDARASAFNLSSPHEIATYVRGSGKSERWHDDPLSAELRTLLFRGERQSLKTSIYRNQHPPLRVHGPGERIPSIRNRLVQIARETRTDRNSERAA